MSRGAPQASAQAALVTRGFVELRRIATAFGAQPETIMGLSGLGDLMLTCSTAQSRNFAYGAALGRGDDLRNLPLAEGDWFGFGSAFKTYAGVLVPGLGARLVGHDATPVPLASSVARLAAWHFARGEVVDAALAAPLYVRDKVALTTAERLASGGKA